jgi:DNA-binding Lrp family transcriptional regulator
MTLLSHSDFHLKPVWPSLKTIAKMTGLSKSTVIRYVQELEEVKLIIRQTRSDGEKGQISTRYFFETSPTPVSTETQAPVSTETQAPVSTGNLPLCPPGHPNNNKRTRINITTTTDAPKLKKRIIQEEYETETHNLEDAVVAILKNLGIKESFWPEVQGMEPNRVKALAKQAEKKADDPAGWFVDAVKGKWKIRGFDKLAFEIECDKIRAQCTHLKSKETGKEYEIQRYLTGPSLHIATADRGNIVLDSELKLQPFTWATV